MFLRESINGFNRNKRHNNAVFALMRPRGCVPRFARRLQQLLYAPPCAGVTTTVFPLVFLMLAGTTVPALLLPALC